MKRINELILQELSKKIREVLPVERHGVISVTEVDVSKDLKTALVYVSQVGVSGQKSDLLESLQKVRGALQGAVARHVILKYIPHLQFHHDRGMAHGQHMVEILDELEKGQKT